MQKIEVTKRGKISNSIKIRRCIWEFCRLFLFRPFCLPPFRIWRIFILKLFGAKLKWSCNIYASTKIWAPWKLQMEDNTTLGPHVICYNQDWVIIDKNTIISQYAYLCTASHETSKLNTAYDSLITAPIHIKANAWIGSKAFINFGVCIGEYAIVGATASVYKNVNNYEIVGGNPAKVLKKRTLNV